MRRVVITGMGAISGNGSSVEEIWQSLKNNEAKRRRIDEYFDNQTNKDPYSVKGELINVVCGSNLSNASLAELLGLKGKRGERYGRHQLFALCAAHEAMQNAKLKDHDESERFGCIGGTGDGGLDETYAATQLLEKGKPLGPFANLRQLPNIATGWVAREFRLQGPNGTDVSACAAASQAVANAARIIKLDEADIMMVVGTEAVITPFGIASFCAQRALANESLPYRKDRKGFLMGEGAAVLILEEYDHAKKRAAEILAELAGYGSAADGDPSLQITDPGKGGIRSAVLALKMAGIGPGKLGYINAHGTGTTEGDVAEIAGVKSWLGESVSQVAISSTKSYTGHLLGAAGALEAILCVKMLRQEIILPTCGLSEGEIDPACDGVRHVKTLEMLERPYILSNSFGFGGTNASNVLRRM